MHAPATGASVDANNNSDDESADVTAKSRATASGEPTMHESLQTLLRRLNEKRKDAHRPEELEVGHGTRGCVCLHFDVICFVVILRQ